MKYQKIEHDELDRVRKSAEEQEDSNILHGRGRLLTCALCEVEFVGWGHALSSIEGVCCDECNWTKVLPARMKGEHL